MTPPPGGTTRRSTPPATNSSRSPAEVGERLYRIAIRRLGTDGFAATAVSTVTREAGVAKGTFFNYFPTKEHLLARALGEMMDGALTIDPGSSGGSDAIPVGLDRMALALAESPHLARAIVPRLGLLPAIEHPADGTGTTLAAGSGTAAETAGRTDIPRLTGPERLRRWIRDRLAESLRSSVPLEEADDQTLSVLLVSAFEATLREWTTAAGGEPPFPRRLLHGRIAYLLVSAGFPRPASPG